MPDGGRVHGRVSNRSRLRQIIGVIGEGSRPETSDRRVDDRWRDVTVIRRGRTPILSVGCFVLSRALCQRRRSNRWQLLVCSRFAGRGLGDGTGRHGLM